jgi:hypothetical protein
MTFANRMNVWWCVSQAANGMNGTATTSSQAKSATIEMKVERPDDRLTSDNDDDGSASGSSLSSEHLPSEHLPSARPRRSAIPLPSSRLGSSFSCCAPAATNPKVYTECRRPLRPRAGTCMYHIGSLQELTHTICDPVVLLLVAFYDPQ